MKSVEFKKMVLKAVFSADDYTEAPEEIEFHNIPWLGKYLDSTIKKEMTGKIKEKGRVGKFENNIEIFDDGVYIVYAKNSDREWYPVFFTISGEDVGYSYD